MRRALLAFALMLGTLGAVAAPASAGVDPIGPKSINRTAGNCTIKVGYSSNFPQSGYIEATNSNCSLIGLLTMTADCAFVGYSNSKINPPLYYTLYSSVPVGKIAGIISYHATGKNGGSVIGNLYR